ncbi:hypothetical protein LCGC14_2518650, partial [marine sediment metagenome]
MKISVIGTGYVGLVAAACLAEGGNHVICVDNDEKKIDDLNNGIIPIYEPGLAEIVKSNEAAGRLTFTTDIKHGIDNSLLIFIGVGTPSADDGSADISAVLNVAAQIGELMDGYRIIITKSTVPVGTCKKVSDVIASKTEKPFDYVSNPEFLKEGNAMEDFMKPDRVVIGARNRQAAESVAGLYSAFMRQSDRIIFTDPASAEMTKYAANAMLALRISFMNDMARLCDRVGANVDSVRRVLGTDKRIGSAFLFPGLGYGGVCLPKDVRALVWMGQQHGLQLQIAEATHQVNDSQAEYFFQTILEYYGGDLSGKHFAVWGLAYKAGTDDVRMSPAVKVIRWLVDRGASVVAHDPEAMDKAAAELGEKIVCSNDMY